MVDRVKEVVASGEQITRDELDLLKNVFYKLGSDDVEEFLRVEAEFKTAMAELREQRAQTQAQQDEERRATLVRKLEIIERVKEMGTSPDEANKCYAEFKTLQAEWKELGQVPPENATEVWRQYQHSVEQFYDLLKLNFEARDYDFKKNLETKLALCEAAERLAEESDVVAAFRQLQTLHEQYRETGPVAKELREEIWNRFKEASTAINKAHQSHFESLRAAEADNLEKKTALCEAAEAIVAKISANTEEIRRSGDQEIRKAGDQEIERSGDQEIRKAGDQAVAWEQLSKEMIALQTEWKTIGFAPHKMNQKIFERFRAACDAFFNAKSEHYKDRKAAFAEAIARRKEIIAKAKGLIAEVIPNATAGDQESGRSGDQETKTDSKIANSTWRSVGDRLINLQKEWKELGNVPHKVGNELWAEFRAECDKFFEARREAQEQANAARQQREKAANARARKNNGDNTVYSTSSRKGKSTDEESADDNETMETKLEKLKALWNFQSKK